MGAVADVSDSDQVGAMVEAAMAEHGRIDVLVNNAGLVSPMLHFFEADEAWWRKIIDVNLTGIFLLLKHGIPVMAALMVIREELRIGRFMSKIHLCNYFYAPVSWYIAGKYCV